MNGRSFTYLDENEMDRILSEVPGLKLIKSRVTTDVRLDRSEQKWLNALLRKVMK